MKKKAGNSAYGFLAEVYNLPKIRTLNEYDTFDTNAQDGILHATVADMENELETYLKTVPEEFREWSQKVILKFDKMKVREKILMNFHTNEIVGFEYGASSEDVLKMDLDALATRLENDDEQKPWRPPVATHILLFMFCRWDAEGPLLKRSVARFSVTNSTGEYLVRHIHRIIAYLYARGFIVNQVASDGATENVSAMKQLTTHSVSEVFSLYSSKKPSSNVPFFICKDLKLCSSIHARKILLYSLEVRCLIG